jgi:hypothetical protein
MMYLVSKREMLNRIPIGGKSLWVAQRFNAAIKCSLRRGFSRRGTDGSSTKRQHWLQHLLHYFLELPKG